MAKSSFRLATLLKLREATRDERRNRLAEAVQAEAVLDQRLEEIERDLDALIEASRRFHQPGAVDLERLLSAGRFELELRAEQQILDQQKQTVADEIESRRKHLTEADRSVRILEKLREKHVERDRALALRTEQKTLDETAVSRRRGEDSSW